MIARPENKILAIRADANEAIGSGHVMRCSVIGNAFRNLGGDVVFLVACEESKEMANKLGFRTLQVDGACFPGETVDANEVCCLVDVCLREKASALLIDSYFMGKDNFVNLNCEIDGRLLTAYIDDLYRRDVGRLDAPERLPVDVVINYSFYASLNAYLHEYEGGTTECLIGVSYAPIRPEFAQSRRPPLFKSGDIRRVLVTSGSTNPRRFLERMTSLCVGYFPDAIVDVVVGPLADFSFNGFPQVVVHRCPASMSELMREVDLAISAAGSTLYELACIGVPALAVAIVDNQLQNAEAFEACGFGVSCHMDCDDGELSRKIRKLVNGWPYGSKNSSRSDRLIIDGHGADRIAWALYGGVPHRVLPRQLLTKNDANS